MKLLLHQSLKGLRSSDSKCGFVFVTYQSGWARSARDGGITWSVFPSKWALPPAFARMILKNSKESLSLLRESSG